MPEEKLYDATLIVTLDIKTGKVLSKEITNVRPSKESMDDYLRPAVEFLASVLRPKIEDTP